MRGLCFTLVLTLASVARAEATQPEVTALLERAEAQVWALEETKAIATLEQALAWSNGSPHELCRIHLLMGMAYSGLANATRAIEHFRTARSLDPVLVLPAQASPRVIEWWDKAAPRPQVLTPLPSAVAEADLDLRAPPRKPLPRWPAYLLGGAGLAAAGASTYFGITALNLDRAARQPGVDALSAGPMYAEASGRAMAANVLWSVTAGLVLGTALTYWLSEPVP